MKSAYENCLLNNSESSIKEQEIVDPVIEDSSLLKSVIENIEELLNTKSENNKITVKGKISKYIENKIIEQLLPMINIEIKTISKSNETVITFFDAEKYRYYL